MENNQSEKIHIENKDKGYYFRVTSRSLENYLITFGLEAKDLKPNAVILDIGSGIEQEFAKELATLRPDIRVISLDPSLGLPTDDKSLNQKDINYDVVSYRLGVKITKI